MTLTIGPSWRQAIRLMPMLLAGLLSACGGARATSTSVPVVPAADTHGQAPAFPGTASASSNVPVSASAVPIVSASVSPTGIGSVNASMSDRRPVEIRLTYNLSDGTSQKSAALRRTLTTRRWPQYISASNTLLSISVTPLGGSSTVYGPSACTGGSCAVSFTATPGANTIAFTLTDGSANVLSKFATTTIVQPSAVNTLNFTANPVVNSVMLTLASSTVTAGTAASVAMQVNATDAAGNTIAGAGDYVDVNGNPVTLLLNVTNTQAGGRGRILLQGPTRITKPSQAPISLRYDGNWIDKADVSVKAPTLITTTGATLTTIPHVIEYSVSGTPSGLVFGRDGNLWFTAFNGNFIGRMATDGTGYTTFPCPPGACTPYFINNGPDGNIWFTELNGSFIDRMTLDGTITRMVSIFRPVRIFTGPDGAVWYNSQGASVIGRFDLRGNATTFATGFSSESLAFGPDGNLWYVNRGGTNVGKMSRNGQQLATYTIASTGIDSNGMVTGPDGNMWFTDHDANAIYQSTLSGGMTPHALQVGALPRDLVVGPDGFFWVTEQGKDSIARLPLTGAPTEYGSAFGISSGAGPIGIIVGPDGNIWFAEAGSDKIAKLVL